MFDLFRLWLGAVTRIFRDRRSLMLENLTLRQQLAVLKRKNPSVLRKNSVWLRRDTYIPLSLSISKRP